MITNRFYLSMFDMILILISQLSYSKTSSLGRDDFQKNLKSFLVKPPLLGYMNNCTKEKSWNQWEGSAQNLIKNENLSLQKNSHNSLKVLNFQYAHPSSVRLIMISIY